jgi:hypothetical protein
MTDMVAYGDHQGSPGKAVRHSRSGYMCIPDKLGSRSRDMDWKPATTDGSNEPGASRLQGSPGARVAVPDFEEQLRLCQLQRRADLCGSPAEASRLQVPVGATRQSVAEEHGGGIDGSDSADRACRRHHLAHDDTRASRDIRGTWEV